MIWTIASIQVGAELRGITRLCHFTPSRNLAHIAEDERGILATQHLSEDEKAVFNQTDLQRLDGHPDYVCCSIQYPNAWYFRNARDRELLFRDWVVLLINSHYLWRAGTKFCPRNSAAEHGRLIGEGAEAFESLFDDNVQGVNTFGRGPDHPPFLPTDEQAEVLIPDRISQHDTIGIAVHDDAQAQREISRLRLLGCPPPKIWVIPEFYNPNALSHLLRAGKIPAEREHRGGVTDAR